jgi:DNA-directed RNA polymerase subunit RPC12/RpoP
MCECGYMNLPTAPLCWACGRVLISRVGVEPGRIRDKNLEGLVLGAPECPPWVTGQPLPPRGAGCIDCGDPIESTGWLLIGKNKAAVEYVCPRCGHKYGREDESGLIDQALHDAGYPSW